jgi:hypothetical protein
LIEQRAQHEMVRNYLSNFIEYLKDDLIEYKDKYAFKYHSLKYMMFLAYQLALP